MFQSRLSTNCQFARLFVPVDDWNAEYEHLQEAHRTSDHYSRQVSLRAFEHLLERELVVFVDGRGRGNTSEFRAVELLISNHELQEGLKSNSVCPVTLQQWFLHEAFK
jgi:origin recognition complex subunit 4